MRVPGLAVAMAAVLWASQANADIKCRIPSPDSDALGRQLLSECLAREGMTREEWDAQFPRAPLTQNVQQTERPWPRDVPEDIRVDLFYCFGVPYPQVEFLAQLPEGGDWSRLDANSYLYSILHLDTVTGRTNDLRYVFTRIDARNCQQGKSCGGVSQLAMNGRYLTREEMKAACYNLGLAAILMKENSQ